MRRKKGFTLLEIMITVSIIGVVSVIGAMSYTKGKANVRATEARMNLRIIYLGQKNYRMHNSSYWTAPANATATQINTALGTNLKATTDTSSYFITGTPTQFVATIIDPSGVPFRQVHRIDHNGTFTESVPS